MQTTRANLDFLCGESGFGAIWISPFIPSKETLSTISRK